MRSTSVLALLLVGLLLGGCVAGTGKDNAPAPAEKIVVQPTEADTILSCLESSKTNSRKDFSLQFNAAQAGASRSEDAAKLQLICCSLHRFASYKQFKEGVDTLNRYIKEHPKTVPSLSGLLVLMQRIDQEKIGRWTQTTKTLDEKGNLEAENREIMERSEILEKNAIQDQARIKELQKQIEQLKNIESIIKNRER